MGSGKNSPYEEKLQLENSGGEIINQARWARNWAKAVNIAACARRTGVALGDGLGSVRL
jgi:hypothetical protein